MIDVYQTVVKGEKNANAGFVAGYVKGVVKDASGVYETRVRGRTMVLGNPAKESRVRRGRREAQARRREERERGIAGVMSRREGRRRGVWRIRGETLRYEMFYGLHSMWKAYMHELLGSDLARGGDGLLGKIAKADLHGAMILVESSVNTSLVGLNGIVLVDSSRAYTVITETDTVKVIPKHSLVLSPRPKHNNAHHQPTQSASPYFLRPRTRRSTARPATKTSPPPSPSPPPRLPTSATLSNSRPSPPRSSPPQSPSPPPRPSTPPPPPLNSFNSSSSSLSPSDSQPHASPPVFTPFSPTTITLTLSPSFSLSSPCNTSPAPPQSPQLLQPSPSTPPTLQPDFFPCTAPPASNDDSQSERRGENIWKLACKRRVGFFYRQYTPQTIRAVVAAQAESESYLNPRIASSKSLFLPVDGHDCNDACDEYDDDDDDDDDDFDIDVECEYTNGERQIDFRAFNIQGFSDFELDLETLAVPNSQPSSSAPSFVLTATQESQPPRPPTPLSTLFSSTAPSLPFPPPRLSTLPVTALRDDAWPRVMGRGTPVDHQRRAHWADPQMCMQAGVAAGYCATHVQAPIPNHTGPIHVTSPGLELASATGTDVGDWSAFLESLLMGSSASTSSASSGTSSVPVDASAAGGGAAVVTVDTMRGENVEAVAAGDGWFELGLGPPVQVPVGGEDVGSVSVVVGGGDVQVATRSPLSFALG